MTKKRQDAWTKDEDMILAETVLRYVRNGKTQIDAFAEAGKQLSRTAAACGFRWNATVRKQYEEAFKLAKQHGKKERKKMERENHVQQHPLDTAISLLESIKIGNQLPYSLDYNEQLRLLSEENLQLKKQLLRYQEVMLEMKNLWEWLEKETQMELSDNK